MTNTCSVSGCGRPHYALTYCGGHYARHKTYGDVRADVPFRQRRSKDLTLPPGILWCNGCQTEKPDEEMQAVKWMRANNRQSGKCKNCHRENRKPQWLKSAYKLTVDDYDRLLAEQGGVCAVCKNPPQKYRFSVDHDHNCCPGRMTCGDCIRGLLCQSCNSKVEWWIDHGDRVKEYLAKERLNGFHNTSD